jgi:hypothetical protein
VDPFAPQLGNWSKAGVTRTFSADKLADYIDGDAERFVRAGVEKALTADYKDSHGAEAVADVFVMKNPGAATKIFDGESPAGSHPVQIGEGARSYGQSVTFRKGAYFARVVAYQETPAVEALAKAVAAELK